MPVRRCAPKTQYTVTETPGSLRNLVSVRSSQTMINDERNLHWTMLEFCKSNLYVPAIMTMSL